MHLDPNDPRFKGLVRIKARQVLRRARLHEQDQADLEQALVTGVLKKLQRYDPARNHLGAFLTRALEFAAGNLFRDLLALKRNPHRARSLDALGSGEEPAPDGELALRGHYGRLGLPVPREHHGADLRLDVQVVLARLPKDLRELAEDLMAGLTPTAIARRQQVSRSKVYACLNRLRRFLTWLAV